MKCFITSRPMAWTARVILTVVPWTAMGMGCQTVTLPEITPEPSALEQVVDAMNREDWDEADRLLNPILPPLPSERGGGNVR